MESPNAAKFGTSGAEKFERTEPSAATTLPIDRLRNGTMTDAEALTVAAGTIRSIIEPGWPESGRKALLDLAARVELVRLLDPAQTRAHSTVEAHRGT